MKQSFLLLLALLSFSVSPSKAKLHQTPQDNITVYVFLHEACIISQYYTLPLRQLYETYANEHTQFIGLFPNAYASREKIAAFKKTYQIPFILQMDHEQTKTKELGVTVTPEVVVYNESKAEIIYQGRISDAYARVGQRKRVSSTSELADVLQALANKQPVEVPNMPAIGCLITKSNPK